MDVRLKYETVAHCHPGDVWHLFSAIEDWRNLCGCFGHAGWVHGRPWEQESRFFIEVLSPRRMDLEVMVVHAEPKREVVLLLHGSTFAAQQWIRFSAHGEDATLITVEQTPIGRSEASAVPLELAFQALHASWFDGLSDHAEKHCLQVAL